MKKPAQTPHRRSGKVELTIGIDLGDVWSHYCTVNQQGEVADRDRFRTTPKAIDKWFIDVPHARVDAIRDRLADPSTTVSTSANCVSAEMLPS